MTELRRGASRISRIHDVFVIGAVIVALTLAVWCQGYAAGPTQPGPGQTLRWTFDSVPVGDLPRGATVLSGAWAVRTEPKAPTGPHVLCQTGTATFPALVLTDVV